MNFLKISLFSLMNGCSMEARYGLVARSYSAPGQLGITRAMNCDPSGWREAEENEVNTYNVIM